MRLQKWHVGVPKSGGPFFGCCRIERPPFLLLEVFRGCCHWRQPLAVAETMLSKTPNSSPSQGCRKSCILAFWTSHVAVTASNIKSSPRRLESAFGLYRQQDLYFSDCVYRLPSQTQTALWLTAAASHGHRKARWALSLNAM